MKRTLAVCVVAFLAFRAEAGDVVIPAGTVFFGTISKTISTKDLAEGDVVPDSAELSEPLIVNGATVVAAGTAIKLLVSELQKGRRARIGDEVTFTAMSTTAVDGSTINLTGTFNAKEATKVAKDVGFAVVTPWTLLKKGAAATIPEGRTFGVTIPAEIRVRAPEPK
jgi:hypothetical protein